MDKSRSNWWIGLVVIIIGVLILLGNFGIVDVQTRELIRTYWPLILVILGIRSLQRKNGAAYLSGGILIVLGLLLQGRKLDFFHFDPVWLWRAFWPVVLILLGVSLLRGPRLQEKSNWAFMGALDRTKHPWKLDNGNYLAFMGGIDLDLRQAQIEPGEYFLNCTAVMGGIDIVAPDDVTVICQGTAILGGIDFFGKENGGIFVSETAEQGRSDGDKVVRLFALAVLGGVEVKGTTAEK